MPKTCDFSFSVFKINRKSRGWVACILNVWFSSLCEKMEHVVSDIFSYPKLWIHPTTFSKALEELRSIHVTKKTVWNVQLMSNTDDVEIYQ